MLSLRFAFRAASIALIGAVALGGCRSGGAADAPNAPADAADAAPKARLFEGTGVYRRDYPCASEEARQFADQGLRFLYGFTHAEAVRSFTEATRLDPECAFAWWGLAAALGPHINRAGVSDDEARRATEAAAKATALGGDRSDALGALCRAIVARFAHPSPPPRRELDRAYATAMREAAKAHPDDPEVACMFAESLMVLRPWDLYDVRGTPREGTAEIVAALETGLARSPDHPGLNHAYIHAVEASTDPGRAIAASDRLRFMAPTLAHLVHMPSHIDLLVGRYDEAVKANLRAVESERAYAAIVGRNGRHDQGRSHAYQVLVKAAMFDGQSEVALKAAKDLAVDFPPERLKSNPVSIERIYTTRIHALVRFGRWDEILAEPERPESAPAAEAARRYARGVAFAAMNKAAEAEAEIPAFEAAYARVPEKYRFGRTPVRAVLAVAFDVLRGEVAIRSGRQVEAFAHLRAAVEKDDALPYDEPHAWPVPARHALGALLMEAGKMKEARAVYEADLRRRPANGWSLHGLAECLDALGDAVGAEARRAEFARAWARADIELNASCFCRRS